MTDYKILTITADAMRKAMQYDTYREEVAADAAIKQFASIDINEDLDLIAWYYVGTDPVPVACDWTLIAPQRVGGSSARTLTFWRDHEGAWNKLGMTEDPRPYRQGKAPDQQPPQPLTCTQCGQHTFTQRTVVTIKPDLRWIPGTPVPTLSSKIAYSCAHCGTSFTPYKDAEGNHWTSHP